MFSNCTETIKISKKLSWLLRHGAKEAGIKISSDGYVYVDELLSLDMFKSINLEKIKEIVEKNEKKRFVLVTEAGGRYKIKACQGHSFELPELKLEAIESSKEAPLVLHGTSQRAWKSIQKEGLSRMNRQHVHFSPGVPGSHDQVLSGYRNSSKVIIHIDIDKAISDGLKFYRSENNVILCAGDFDGFIRPEYFKKVDFLT